MIIDYIFKFDEEIKDLLVELQEYMVSIDVLKYNKISLEFRGKYFNKIIEDYLKLVGCKVVLLGVLAYNEHAAKFYKKNGYHNRLIEMTKKV